MAGEAGSAAPLISAWAVFVPVAAYLAKGLLENYGAFRRLKRKQSDSLSEVVVEISTLLPSLNQQAAALSAALSNSMMARRIEADIGYAPYLAPVERPGDAAYTRLVKDLQLVSTENQRCLLEFYDLQAMLNEQLNDYRSDEFKSLLPSRKLSHLRKVLIAHTETITAAKKAKLSLRLNLRDVDNATLWEQFFGYVRSARNLTGRSKSRPRLRNRLGVDLESEWRQRLHAKLLRPVDEWFDQSVNIAIMSALDKKHAESAADAIRTSV